MKKVLYPALAVLLLSATVVQVRATRDGKSVQPSQQIVAEKPVVVAEGRLVAYPGAEVTVGSDATGSIERLLVEEKQTVRAGQVIARIAADDTKAALAVARSRVGEADADIRLFASEVARAQHLFREDVGSKQAVDKAERDLEASRARRGSAVAEVHRLEALVEKSVITAPIDGVVITRFVHAGETITNGDPVITIANLDRTRVEAEIDEFDAARVQLGGKAVVKAEGYDGQWRGTIEEIPDTVVSRRLKPQDPSKPIDARVLLVKIAFDEAAPLKLGQRVEVRIE